MNTHLGRETRNVRPIIAAALLFASSGNAADGESPLTQGPYIAPMFSHVEPHDDRRLDTGRGGTLALGYRLNQNLALELAGLYSKLDREVGDGEAKMTGANVSGLGFLSQKLPGLFFAFGVGYLDTDHQATSGGNYAGTTFEAGLGYLFPLSFGRYDFGIRAEARWRHNNGQDSDQFDEADHSGLHDRVLNLGLQLPLGLRQPPAPPPVEEPVRVVEPVPLPPPPPPPQCQAEFRPGQTFSLSGCGTGSVIVLRGVTFDFDESRLTPNAKTVLDVVAAELVVHTGIRVEVSGHTDAIGSDAYNEKLSERRAQAVMDYLVEKGVARDRLTSSGFGESKPIADNATEEGRELNRRVELKVTSVDGEGAALPVSGAAPASATPADPADAAGLDFLAPTEVAPAAASTSAPSGGTSPDAMSTAFADEGAATPASFAAPSQSAETPESGEAADAGAPAEGAAAASPASTDGTETASSSDAASSGASPGDGTGGAAGGEGQAPAGDATTPDTAEPAPEPEEPEEEELPF